MFIILVMILVVNLSMAGSILPTQSSGNIEPKDAGSKVHQMCDSDVCSKISSDSFLDATPSSEPSSPDPANLLSEENIEQETVSELHIIAKNGQDAIDLYPTVEATFKEEFERNQSKYIAVDGSIHNISLDNYFRYFLSNEAPYSYKTYQESFKDKDVQIGQWSSDCKEKTYPSIQCFEREMKFIKYVGLPGCSTTKAIKSQTLKRFGHEGLILYSSTRVFDVPSADTFTVDEMFAIQSIEDGKSIKVTLTCQVNFVKNTFFKGMIESNAISETKKWLQAYFKYVQSKSTLDLISNQV